MLALAGLGAALHTIDQPPIGSADDCDVMTECHVASQTKASKENKHVIAFSAFDCLGLEPAIN